MKKYKGLISSDWSECLAPCGPFDYISFIFPELTSELASIFKAYTGNEILLSKAMQRIHDLLPVAATAEQMDTYLEACFATYKGVPELIEWCHSRDILFMINTTSVIGYFQRILAKKMLPPISVLSAHPSLIYPQTENDPACKFNLLEISDKPRHTAEAGRLFNISTDHTIVIGDSGGDGPHFQWAAEHHIFRIGSMTKPSLQQFCDAINIEIDLKFGTDYRYGEEKKIEDEIHVDFRDLIPIVERVILHL
jgi:hypothetical protein